jgi:cytoskeleton protein RodZ
VGPDMKNADYTRSVGELLKSTRESKKLTLNDVHQDTKMTIPVLRALEQDDFSPFESEIYLKGFLKTYAKYLGIDPDAAVKKLDEQRGTAVAAGVATWDIEESIKEDKVKSPRILTRIVVPLLILVIIILSILLALERRKVQELRSNFRRVGQTTEEVESG